MYAIIRAGGKQAKVSEGDVVDVDRVKTDGDVIFVPLLIVQKDGTVISDRDKLANATVTAEILGESSGPKVDIFKYKAKTGYRRRAGHRQKYTQLQIKKIDVPGAKKPAAKKPAAKKPAAKSTTAKSTTARKPAAKSTTAEKPVAKSTTAKKTAAKSATEPAKKKATSSSTAKSTTAKKPAAKKKPPDAEKGA